MRNSSVNLGKVVITQDGTESTVLEMRKQPLRGINIFGPADLVGVVTVEVSWNFFSRELPADVLWHKLQSGGANIEIGVDQAVPIDFVGWVALRVVSTLAETATQGTEFVVLGVEELK